MSLYDTPELRAADQAIDFAARRDREERRSFARRPKKISDILAQLLNKRGYGRLAANHELAEAWSAAAGRELAAVSRPGKLSRGTLEVTVTNSTMTQEFTFHKHQILAELGRTLPDAKIRNLRFRVGSITQ
jgi:predicted nucleic acid-binding Zn ribbon protein